GFAFKTENPSLACGSRPPYQGVNSKSMRRSSIALAVLGALLIALPFLVGNYALSVATLILYFAYTGQAWNVMMGFAGQLSLGHLRRVLRAPHHRLRRVHAHRLRSLRLDRRPGRHVPARRAARHLGPRQLPRPAAHVLLRHAASERRRIRAVRLVAALARGLLLAGDPRGRGSGARARHQCLPLEAPRGGDQRRADRGGARLLRLLLQQPLPRA